ncbi:hypothetical protein GCM10017752_12180 [Streptomyces roseoviridis]
MIRVQGIVSNVSRRDPKDGYSGRLGYFTFEEFEVVINGPRLPSRVSKNCVIDLREGAVGGQCEQGTGLNAGTEGNGTKLGIGGNEAS